jgi:hypothetical protein
MQKVESSDESLHGRSSLFRGRASLIGATLENLDETAVFGEISSETARSYIFGAVSPAPSSSAQSYIFGAVSSTPSSCIFTGQSGVPVPVHDCSAYASPAEMLSQDMEYPCMFAGMEGCEGKVTSFSPVLPGACNTVLHLCLPCSYTCVSHATTPTQCVTL